MTDEPIDGPADEPTDEEADESRVEEPDESPIDEPVESTVESPVESLEHPAAPKGPPAKRARWGLRTRVSVASLALVAMMFLFVFPTRAYIAQQRQVGDARNAVAVLRAQNKVLQQQARRLRTPEEIERLARRQFNMVLPGEQAYNVVPPADEAATTTTSTP